MKNYKELIMCYSFFSKFAWKNNKSYFLLLFLRLLVNSVGPFISIIGTRYLIDELISDQRDIKKLIIWVAFICVGNFLYQTISKFISENLGRLNENFARILETKLCLACINMKFEYTEDTEVLDMIKNAQRSLNETGHVNGLIGPLFDVVSNIIVLICVVSLVCTSLPWLLLPITISFFVKYFVENKINIFRKKYFRSISEVERGGEYYNEELQDVRYAKDIRLYEAKEIFNEQYDGYIDTSYNYMKKFAKKFAVLYSIDDLITEIFSIVVYFLLGINVLWSRITIGQFSSLFQATTQFNKSLHQIVRKYTDVMYMVLILKYYVEFVDADLELQDENKNRDEKNAYSMIDKCDIEFKNVSFKYPRTDRYILKNISIKIQKGEHISIVGENGAGKTTFIKLLCGLYSDYEGEIVLNGKNINEYSYSEYIKLLSVVFQDFKLFAFSLRENITIFEDKMEDLEKIYELSDLSEWINKLKNGDQTYIYKYFVEEGVEPSGGQGQKIAIARALYKNAPFVILDEPTAAMDPISENEIYENFNGLVKNKTAIYISHRLSSCKFCDRIVVFKDGKIIEEGSHDSLMRLKDGFYSHMYNTQAQWYS